MTTKLTRAEEMAEAIAGRAIARAGQAPLLVAISGIDGSGKSWVSKQVEGLLESRGIRVASIPVDPWHRLGRVRRDAPDPGDVFYREAYRFDELFGRLIEPLHRNRAASLTVELVRTSEDVPYVHTYEFSDIDVIVLEGIFLLKRELRGRYDLSFWVECSFASALERALARNQENRSREQLIEDYNRIYFAAQKIHLARDDPRAHADYLFLNEGL